MLRIDSVLIENLKGIKRAEFPLGSLTVIQGANGVGKSSILDAIRAVFEGGHDPSLIRIGSEKALVRFVLSDGTTISKTIKPKESTLLIKREDGRKVEEPASFLKRLAKGFSFDPISFLHADAKKRTQYLLEALPCEFKPDEVAAITGKLPATVYNLVDLAQLRAGLYDARHDLNVAAKELESTIQGFSKTMPDAGDEDWPAKADALAAKKTTLATALATLKAQIKADYTSAAAAAKETLDTAVNAATATYNEAIQELRGIAAEMEAEQSAALQAELQTVSAEFATADERRRQQDQALAMERQIESLDAKRRLKVSASEKLTLQLQKLDTLRKTRLADVAIPGIDMVDGQILVNGVDLDNLNTQAKFFTAFQIAALRSGELGFMLVDGLEAIVGEEWQDFQEAAMQSGYQVLGARAVEHRPLSLETDGKEVELT
jgi:hypothetical protein